MVPVRQPLSADHSRTRRSSTSLPYLGPEGGWVGSTAGFCKSGCAGLLLPGCLAAHACTVRLVAVGGTAARGSEGCSPAPGQAWQLPAREGIACSLPAPDQAVWELPAAACTCRALTLIGLLLL
jgi:hypothetical protein